jgi:DNA ligase-1
MRLFTRLFIDLDASTRTSDKVAALVRYFSSAPAEDAAWALRFLSGQRPARAVSGRLLLGWVAERTQLPAWLVDECHHLVGDLAETMALLLPDPQRPEAIPLHRLVHDHLLPLAQLGEAQKRSAVERTWDALDARERLVYHKLITGEFRVGVAKNLVIRGLAQAAGLPPAIVAHRLMGSWETTAAGFANLMATDAGHLADPGRPYPFCLAHPLAVDPATLGGIGDWQAEWKWDGIRAQVIRRGGDTTIWSRGEDLVTEQFPDLAAALARLPDGTVLDGEILAWEGDRPRSFATLQRRLGRVKVSARMQQEVPLVVMAYDLLEYRGEDLRGRPLTERRQQLERLVLEHHLPQLRLSPVVPAVDWPELATVRQSSREHGVEGLMLKRRSSPYRVGRVVGDWWKWKIDPFHVDAVMVYAQYGHGQRAGLYTDYTFAVWDHDQLVPVAKAYSGLAQEEIREVDRFIRTHSTAKFGPVRQVEPTLVFELAFEGIQASPRHKSGIALRFPRIARWRQDKPAAEADTLESLRQLLAARGLPASASP